ncbi:hypothetical protein HDU97_006220 [Phlyctochytrium planicorne]|nr:hypothetical protein HDU97_006220 [Phlyctochytrium planicorne]
MPKRRQHAKGIHLSDWDQKADSICSYIAMIEERLYDSLLYNRWLDMDNFSDSTRPVMVHSLPLVSRHYLPSQLRDRARERLRAYGQVLDENGDVVNENAKKAFSASKNEPVKAPSTDAKSTPQYSEQEELVRAARRESFFKFMSVVTALGLFTSYVMYNGIIRIEIQEEEED